MANQDYVARYHDVEKISVKHKYVHNWNIVDAFLNHLKTMSEYDWANVDAMFNTFTEKQIESAERRVSRGFDNSFERIDLVSVDAAVAAWDIVEWDAAGKARKVKANGDAAVNAIDEILTADYIQKKKNEFFFLPMFGFANEQAVLEGVSNVSC